MNQLPVLLIREFQEHRGGLFIVPLVVIGFFLVMLLLSIMTNQVSGQVEIRFGDDTRIDSETRGLSGDLDARINGLANASPEVRQQIYTSVANRVSSPMLLVLWIVVFFYLLGTLYDERKDRSILFFKSMPVSDTMTVLSKWLTAAFVAPAIYLVAIITVQVVSTAVITVVAILNSVENWALLWEPVSLLSHWGKLALYFLFAAVWCLPFFGWMLFVSAFTKSLPFLWAVGLPIAIIVVEWMLVGGSTVREWMGQHTIGIAYSDHKALQPSDMLSRLMSVEFVISLGVGLALLYGAVRMRARGDEI
ncbi:MAG: hypothetical protein WD356_03190 [Pseudomonadales bacterium]